MSKRKAMASKTRKFVLERDGFVCQYCGGKANSVDHILPRSQGGKSYRNNLVASCMACNLIAHDRIFSTFAIKKQYVLMRRAELEEDPNAPNWYPRPVDPPKKRGQHPWRRHRACR